MTVNELQIANMIVDPDYTVLDNAFTSEAGRMVFELRHLSLHKQQTVVAISQNKCYQEIIRIITDKFQRTKKVPPFINYLLSLAVGKKMLAEILSEHMQRLTESLNDSDTALLIREGIDWSKFISIAQEVVGPQWYKVVLELEDAYVTVVDSDIYWLFFYAKQDIDEFIQRRDDELQD